MLSEVEMLEVERRLTAMRRDADGLHELLRQHSLGHAAHALGAACDLMKHVQEIFQSEHTTRYSSGAEEQVPDEQV